MLTTLRTGALLTLVLAGCTGSVESAPPDPGSGPRTPGTGGGGGHAGGSPIDEPATSALCAGEPAVGPSLLRRLSNVELQRTLQDLFQLTKPPSLEGVPADNDKDGFTTFTEVQPMSAQHLRAYLDKVDQLAGELLSDATRLRAVLGCTPSEASCLSSFVASFGKLAYRRALSDEEHDALVARSLKSALDQNDQVRYALQALLISPDFLYRIEVGASPDGVSTLSRVELASKLSFALWGRGPSAELLRQAEAGELDSAAGLHAVASEMLEDPRARDFYNGFFRQWLGYAQLRAPVVKPADWSDSLLTEMQTETDTVLAKHAFGGGSLLAALTTNETVLAPALAKFYGLPAPSASGDLSIPSAHPRANAGVLGHASLLSLKSDGDMVALRGNWVRRTFFCSSLSIPPEVAAELGDLLVGLTRVEIVKKRNEQATCKGCHALIDPIGVGLSAFDQSGRWDKDADITQYGITPSIPDLDAPFDSLASLADKLKDAPEVSACLAEKAFVYIDGRFATGDDQCTLDRATRTFADKSDFRALLSGLVDAPSFRLRRAALPTATAEK